MKRRTILSSRKKVADLIPASGLSKPTKAPTLFDHTSKIVRVS